MDTNLSPSLLLCEMQKFLQTRSAFFPFVEENNIIPFTHGHSGNSAYSWMDRAPMEAFHELCRQFVDKFDSHIRSQLLAQAPPSPTMPFWGGARCVGGYSGREHLLKDFDYTRFVTAPQLLDTFVLDRWPIRRDGDGWVVAPLQSSTHRGMMVSPYYRAARFESRFWIRPQAIFGRTQVKDFVKVGWSKGRFSAAYQFGYEIDRDEVRQDCFERQQEPTA